MVDRRESPPAIWQEGQLEEAVRQEPERLLARTQWP